MTLRFRSNWSSILQRLVWEADAIEDRKQTCLTFCETHVSPQTPRTKAWVRSPGRYGTIWCNLCLSPKARRSSHPIGMTCGPVGLHGSVNTTYLPVECPLTTCDSTQLSSVLEARVICSPGGWPLVWHAGLVDIIWGAFDARGSH